MSTALPMSMGRRLVRAAIEVGVTSWLAGEFVQKVTDNNVQVATDQQKAQLLSTLAEQKVLKDAIHNGMINHLRQQVLPPAADNFTSKQKMAKVATADIEEFLHDLLPELDYSSKKAKTSAVFDVLVNSEVGGRKDRVVPEFRNFTLEDMRLMASYNPPPKDNENVLLNILSMIGEERSKQIRLEQQTDRNLFLQEKEICRQSDIGIAKVCNYATLTTTAALSVLMGFAFFKTTDFMSGKFSFQANVMETVATTSRQTIFRRTMILLPLQLLYIVVREDMRADRLELQEELEREYEEMDEDDGQHGEGTTSADEFSLTEWLSNFWLNSPLSVESLYNDGSNDEDATGPGDDGMVLTLRREPFEHTPAVWPCAQPNDPYTLDRRKFYAFVLPLAQVLLFQGMLLRSLLTYLPVPLAHAFTLAAVVDHEALLRSPMTSQQLPVERLTNAILGNAVVQAASHCFFYKLPYVLTVAFFTHFPTLEDEDLPEPTSVIHEDTERYSIMTRSVALMTQIMLIGAKRLGLLPSTVASEDWSSSGPRRQVTQRELDTLVKAFSSDHYNVDPRSQKIVAKDMLDLYCAFHAYMRQFIEDADPQPVSYLSLSQNGSASPSKPAVAEYRADVVLFRTLFHNIFFNEFTRYLHIRADDTPGEKENSSTAFSTTTTAKVNDGARNWSLSKVCKDVDSYDPVYCALRDEALLDSFTSMFSRPDEELTREEMIVMIHALFYSAKLPFGTDDLQSNPSVAGFLKYAERTRIDQSAWDVNKVLDLAEAFYETSYRADQMLFKYYEPHMFARYEQEMGGRVTTRAKGPLARLQSRADQYRSDVQRILEVLTRRQLISLGFAAGMSLDAIEFLLKSKAAEIPELKSLQKEWEEFYADPTNISRLRKIQDLDTNLQKQRLFR